MGKNCHGECVRALPVLPLALGRAWSSEDRAGVLRLSRKPSAEGRYPHLQGESRALSTDLKDRTLGSSGGWWGWLVTAPSNPSVLTPRALPHATKPPGAHELQQNEREQSGALVSHHQEASYFNECPLPPPSFLPTPCPKRQDLIGEEECPRGGPPHTACQVLEWKGWKGRKRPLLLQVRQDRSAAVGREFASHGLSNLEKELGWVFNHQMARKLSCGLQISLRDLTQEILPTILPLCLPCTDWASRRSP